MRSATLFLVASSLLCFASCARPSEVAQARFVQRHQCGEKLEVRQDMRVAKFRERDGLYWVHGCGRWERYYCFDSREGYRCVAEP